MSAVAKDVFSAQPAGLCADDMQRVFARHQARAIQLRSSTKAERLAKIRKLRDVLTARQDDIYKACYADFKKPETEVDVAEMVPIFAEIKHCESHLGRWMKGQRVWPTSLMLGTKTRVKYDPKGATLIISPWNYPINLTLMPLVSAIAAGCTAMIKPSELTPHCSALIKSICEEVFDADEVAVFEGEVAVSQALLELPFDHIFFTGSPAVGKIVMAAAAKNLTSVTLELGGKSPTIVDETADLKRAAISIMWGKYANCGQTCIAPDYLYVHQSVQQEFTAACREWIIKAYGDDPMQSEHYPRMVNDRHFGRVKGLLDEAVEKGAKLDAGGQLDANDNYIAPTLLNSVPSDARLMQEEIFGPLLPIIPYRDINEVISHINANPKPLALYVFTKNSRLADKVLTETSAGGSCVNMAMAQYLHINAPFGGVNNSGIGNSHGLWGFKAFSHERTVVENKFSISYWMAPPYTDFVKKLVAFTLKTLK